MIACQYIPFVSSNQSAVDLDLVIVIVIVSLAFPSRCAVCVCCVLCVVYVLFSVLISPLLSSFPDLLSAASKNNAQIRKAM